MHKLTMSAVFLFLNFSLLFAAETPASKANWNQKMQELRSALSVLLPDLISDQQFSSPKNYERIETNVKKLADLMHGMPNMDSPQSKMAMPADQDRSILLISGLFKNEVLRAYENLFSGHRDYARAVLKNVPGFCIVCHTRSSSPDLSGLQTDAPKGLESNLERAEFYEATRQFDRALDEFEKILEDPSGAESQPFQWHRAAGYGIATAVRVKQDPDRALRLVSHVIASPRAPVFLKEEARHWEISLQQWKKEKVQKPVSAEELFGRAKSLMAEAKNIQQYPADDSADVLYLRASALLHDFLGQYPNNSNAGEALLLLGTCYETLRDLQLWSLHDLYYEACVRQFPHSSVAESCYRRYEQSTYFGFTGSSGTYLPLDVKRHLSELKKLAEMPKSNPN